MITIIVGIVAVFTALYATRFTPDDEPSWCAPVGIMCLYLFVFGLLFHAITFDWQQLAPLGRWLMRWV